jgi:hypothetical protein
MTKSAPGKGSDYNAEIIKEFRRHREWNHRSRSQHRTAGRRASCQARAHYVA